MTDIFYPVRVKMLEAQKKNKELLYAARLLGRNIYALPVKGDEEPMLLYEGAKSYDPRTGAILTSTNEVFVDGVACDTIKVDDAFMVSGKGDYVMITGRRTVTYWNFRSNKVSQVEYEGYITHGSMETDDIIVIIMDGEVYVNMRKLPIGRKIENKDIKYYRMSEDNVFTTTNGFIFKRTLISLDKTPQKYYVINDKAVLLVDNEILVFTLDGNKFNIVLSDELYDDIVVVGNKLFGLDDNGVCEILIDKDAV